MIQPTIEKVLAVMNAKGYRIYDTDSIEYNLTIVGVRSKNIIPDKFDDTLMVFHKFLGNWQIVHYPITTDPSQSYLINPLPEVAHKGTAILKEGQYLSAYCIDKHKDLYYALCQRLQNVTVYRDNNRDGKLNMNPAKTETDMLQINIHKGPQNGNWDSNNINYSAGCQVFADTRYFQEFMLKCRNGEKSFGNSFSYTLLNEADFN